MGEGETLGLVLIGSDKTLLTNHTGNKSCYAVYISCGNIDKRIRTKESAGAWLMVGQIPAAQFEDRAHKGLLHARLYHICMDIIMRNLKKASREPVEMPDSSGALRLVRTILHAHLADYPEQLLISCTAANTAPHSMAHMTHFEDSNPHPLKHRDTILALIDKATKAVDPDRLGRFKTHCTSLGINGVVKPFWRDWKYADPCTFLAPDALHQWHQFFWDHPMKWVRSKRLLGRRETEMRYRCLQKRVGEKFFGAGFTSLNQMTGREKRDLTSHFVGILNGHPKITPPIMDCFRGLIDFIYLAQYESHSTETLGYLDEALAAFHDNKEAVAASGVRRGVRRKNRFNIQKIELFHHVRRLIEELGSTPQFTAEQTEHCHMTMAKLPYRHTNRKGYAAQMCRFLDRQEKIHLFDLFLSWTKLVVGDPNLADPNEEFTGFGTISPAEFAEHLLPQQVQNEFEEDNPQNETTAFVLTSTISKKAISFADAASLFKLPSLEALIVEYFKHGKRIRDGADAYTDLNRNISLDSLDIWYKVRMQLYAEQDEKKVLPLVTVTASPPSEAQPFGLCNFVLVRDPEDAASSGIRGASSVFSLSIVLSYARSLCCSIESHLPTRWR